MSREEDGRTPPIPQYHNSIPTHRRYTSAATKAKPELPAVNGSILRTAAASSSAAREAVSKTGTPCTRAPGMAAQATRAEKERTRAPVTTQYSSATAKSCSALIPRTGYLACRMRDSMAV